MYSNVFARKSADIHVRVVGIAGLSVATMNVLVGLHNSLSETFSQFFFSFFNVNNTNFLTIFRAYEKELGLIVICQNIVFLLTSYKQLIIQYLLKNLSNTASRFEKLFCILNFLDKTELFECPDVKVNTYSRLYKLPLTTPAS